MHRIFYKSVTILIDSFQRMVYNVNTFTVPVYAFFRTDPEGRDAPPGANE